MTQEESWKELLNLYEDLMAISDNIQDFAVEEAIDTIILACDNYVEEKHDGQKP